MLSFYPLFRVDLSDVLDLHAFDSLSGLRYEGSFTFFLVADNVYCINMCMKCTLKSCLRFVSRVSVRNCCVVTCLKFLLF